MQIPTLLSDPHNFGRSCVRDGSYIIKHRSLYTESQLFSPQSSLRRFIKDTLKTELKLIPTLSFADLILKPSLRPQKMEFIEVRPLGRRLTDVEIEGIGEIYAVLAALGVSDQHKENVLFGEDVSGSPVMAPIDLEMFYSHFFGNGFGFNIPKTETYKSKTSISVFDAYRKSYPDPAFSCKIYFGYRRMLRLIERNFEEFHRAFWGRVSPMDIPSRVISKFTLQYYKFLRKNSFTDCFPEEVNQLTRGDIPYFFSFIGAEKAFFWKNEEAYDLVRSPFVSLGPWPKMPVVDDVRLSMKYLTLFEAFDPQFGIDAPETVAYKDIIVIHRRTSKQVVTEDFSVVTKLTSRG